MEQEISGISKFPKKKKDNLERWTEIFETNFRKISVPFNSGNSGPLFPLIPFAPTIFKMAAHVTQHEFGPALHWL